MLTYYVIPFLNERPDGKNFLRGFTVGDPLQALPTFRVEAETPKRAAKVMFEIGNIGKADADGHRWPQARSLSVGDILIVCPPESKGEAVTLEVSPVGFTERERLV